MRLLVLSLAAVLAWAQGEQKRDLKLDTRPTTVGPPATLKPGTVAVPRSYALVVGISQYPNLPAEGQLSFPDRDAESMYSVLISAEGGQFPAENVHKLIGAQATLAKLHSELEQWLPSVAKEDDRVVIYFAGHGFVYDGRAYLAPYDVNRQNIPGTAYPMETLGKVIGGKIRARWKVLLTDACHSGSITPEADRAQVNRSLLDLNQTLFSLTASRDREQSFEDARWGGGHGAFTYFVQKGLQGAADANGDGYVTADELAEYVRVNVRKDTGDRQNPTSDRGSFDPDMVLASIPGHVGISEGLAARYGRLVIETNMDGVEVFVDNVSQGVVNKATPLPLPGIAPGEHTVQGVHIGYEPDGPRQVNVQPGRDTAVSIKITIVRRRPRAATDHLDKGLQYYNKGSKENYQKAVEEFQQALTIDPKYSQAALYLARTYNSLFDEANAKKYFQQALAIDPDYTEAHASYGAMLLDLGDQDESVRQLNAAVQRDPNNEMSEYLFSIALTQKGMFDQGAAVARKAIQLDPNRAEGHLCLAKALSHLKDWTGAEAEYNRYLELSNFDSKLGGQLNYYILGSLFGMGKKKRAAQTDVWRDMRSDAYFGLCEAVNRQKRYDEAIAYCQKALAFDPSDPFSHYLLGLTFSEKYNQAGGLGLLAAARGHFDQVITLNPDTDEAAKARNYIQKIDSVIAQSK